MTIRNIVDKQLFHDNITIKKAFYFAISCGIGGVIIISGTYILTEILGIYYLLSTVIAGLFAYIVKFLVNAVWTFKN